MQSILNKIKAFFAAVNWLELVLVAVFGLVVFFFTKKLGDLGMIFVAWIFIRWVIGKIKKAQA